MATATIAGCRCTTRPPPPRPPRPSSLVAAIRNEEQYPTVAEFTLRLAEDHAKPEFTHCLADLLDRLANHPGATPDI